jgi:hypothetical protein
LDYDDGHAKTIQVYTEPIIGKYITEPLDSLTDSLMSISESEGLCDYVEPRIILKLHLDIAECILYDLSKEQKPLFRQKIDL